MAKYLKLLKRHYRYLIAGLYLFGVLVFGEIHPFSTYPMYNSFPNWSYTFYFTDENNKLIPSSELNLTTGDINHKFYAICLHHGIDYGNGIESSASLYQIGEQMTHMILDPNVKYKFQTIRLHRIYFKYENDTIIQQDTVIYEKHF